MLPITEKKFPTPGSEQENKIKDPDFYCLFTNTEFPVSYNEVEMIIL